MVNKIHRWTQNEIDFLKTNYNKLSISEISIELKCSIQSIRYKICNLKLKPNHRRPFSSRDKKFLIDNYSKNSNATLAKILNRSIAVIQNTASQLNLKKEEKIKIGMRFGKLVVLEELGLNNRRHGRQERQWKCQCDCGKETVLDTYSLNKKGTRSCGCYRIDLLSTSVEHIGGGWFGCLKRRSKARNLEFNLTKEYLNQLFKSQDYKCALSGLPITLDKTRKYWLSTASLDRIDNNQGYIKGNVQFVHKHINYMKWKHNQKYFLWMCKQVSQYQESLNE